MPRLKRDSALARAVGERIRAARQAVGCSQTGLGRLLGLRQGIVWTWEAGKALPSCTTLPHLCRALRVSADYLLGLDEAHALHHIDGDPTNNDVSNLRLVRVRGAVPARIDAPCNHASCRPGPRVPLRYGSSPTEVCCACSMYRLTLHVPGPWRAPEQMEKDLEEVALW